jgi:hypothetical protein
MFKEFEIGYHWDEEYYDELQNKIGGCVGMRVRPMSGPIDASIYSLLP